MKKGRRRFGRVFQKKRENSMRRLQKYSFWHGLQTGLKLIVSDEG
jgi:hypothetical protein